MSPDTFIKHCRRLAATLALSVCCLAQAASGEEEDRSTAALEAIPELEACIRLPSLGNFAQKSGEFLVEVTHKEDGREAFLRTLGEFLRNPSLIGVARDAYVEVSFLNFVVNEKQMSGFAAAFPLADPPAYLRNISTRANLVNETLPGGIVRLREDRPGAQESFAAVVHGRIVVFGDKQAVVECARNAYIPFRDGLMAGAKGDLALRLHASRMLGSHSADIDRGLAQFTEDVSSEAARQSSFPPATFHRMSVALLSNAKSIAAGMEIASLELRLGKAGIRAELSCGPAGQQALEPATPGSQGSFMLAGLLPKRCIACDIAQVKPDAARRFIKNIGDIIATGLETPASQEASQSLNNILDAAIALEPQEIATASVASTKQGETPDMAMLLKAGSPEHLPALLALMAKALHDSGPLHDLMERNGMGVSFAEAPAAWKGEDPQPVEINIGLRALRGGETTSNPSMQRKYIIGQAKNCLVMVSGPNAKATLHEILLLAKEGGQKPGNPVALALPPKQEDTVWLGAFQPLKCLQGAAWEAAGTEPAPKGQTSPLAVYAGLFARAKDSGGVVSWSYATSVGRTKMGLLMPANALADLYEACLAPMPEGGSGQAGVAMDGAKK